MKMKKTIMTNAGKLLSKQAMKKAKGGAWLASPAGQRTADPTATGGCSANAIVGQKRVIPL